MYQSIGINLSKNLDAATKRIKVPAITQRDYYKDKCNNEFIKFYDDAEDFNDEINEMENLEYLEEDIDDTEEWCNSCFNVNSKGLALIGIGAIVGVISLYLLTKRK